MKLVYLNFFHMLPGSVATFVPRCVRITLSLHCELYDFYRTLITDLGELDRMCMWAKSLTSF